MTDKALKAVEEAREENERWQTNNGYMLQKYEKEGSINKIQFAQDQERIHDTIQTALSCLEAVIRDVEEKGDRGLGLVSVKHSKAHRIARDFVQGGE